MTPYCREVTEWLTPRCAHCDRPMRPQGQRAADGEPGTIAYGAAGRCATCDERLRVHGSLDGWMPRQPGYLTRPGRPDDGQRPVRFLAVDRPWLDSALCAQADPEAWYPGEDGSPHKAKAICGRCPVQEPCLTDALDRGDVEYGIIGGLTAKERRRLRRGAA